MSVKITIEMLVHGLDDPETVDDALAGRTSYWHGELEDALWQGCKDSGLDISETEVLRVRIEADDSQARSRSDG